MQQLHSLLAYAGLALCTLSCDIILALCCSLLVAGYVIGDLADTLDSNDKSAVNRDCLYFLLLGVAAFIFSTLQMACWDWAAEVCE